MVVQFTVNVLVKWFSGVFKSRFNELDETKKRIFTRDSLIDWLNQKWVICDLICA